MLAVALNKTAEALLQHLATARARGISARGLVRGGDCHVTRQLIAANPTHPASHLRAHTACCVMCVACDLASCAWQAAREQRRLEGASQFWKAEAAELAQQVVREQCRALVAEQHNEHAEARLARSRQKLVEAHSELMQGHIGFD